MAISDTLSKVFKWKKSVDYNGLTFYLRVVGDQVLEDARKAALLESRKLRKALRDVNTDEYLMYIDGFEDLSNDQLLDLIVAVSGRQYAQDYIKSTPKPHIDDLGDYPTQEEQENYEAAKIQRDEDYKNDFEVAYLAWESTFRAGLKTKDRAFLLSLAAKYQIDSLAEAKFSDVFEDYVVFASVYSDKDYKKRSFTNVDDYRELPSDLKQLLRNTYDNINVSSEEIKN